MSETNRGVHQPIEDAPSLDDLTACMWPEDVYEHPEWYTFGLDEEWGREAVRIVKMTRSKPDALITIFRALPPGAERTILTGDWVAIAEGYARQHAMQSDDVGEDWPVIKAQVPAHTIRNGGSDLNEWGYWGPPTEATLA